MTIIVTSLSNYCIHSKCNEYFPRSLDVLVVPLLSYLTARLFWLTKRIKASVYYCIFWCI